MFKFGKFLAPILFATYTFIRICDDIHRLEYYLCCTVHYSTTILSVLFGLPCLKSLIMFVISVP